MKYFSNIAATATEKCHLSEQHFHEESSEVTNYKSCFQRQHLADRNAIILSETNCYRESEKMVGQLKAQIRDEHKEMVTTNARFNDIELQCIDKDKSKQHIFKIPDNH